MDILVTAFQSGLASLASYLAAHVLLCLVPAFFIAGALAALVPQQAIIRFLGPDAPKYISYPAAAGAGSLLAVCSCTIQPLFAGIYSKGAGLGLAIVQRIARRHAGQIRLRNLDSGGLQASLELPRSA